MQVENIFDQIQKIRTQITQIVKSKALLSQTHLKDLFFQIKALESFALIDRILDEAVDPTRPQINPQIGQIDHAKDDTDTKKSFPLLGKRSDHIFQEPELTVIAAQRGPVQPLPSGTSAVVAPGPESVKLFSKIRLQALLLLKSSVFRDALSEKDVFKAYTFVGFFLHYLISQRENFKRFNFARYKFDLFIVFKFILRFGVQNDSLRSVREQTRRVLRLPIPTLTPIIRQSFFSFQIQNLVSRVGSSTKARLFGLVSALHRRPRPRRISAPKNRTGASAHLATAIRSLQNSKAAKPQNEHPQSVLGDLGRNIGQQRRASWVSRLVYKLVNDLMASVFRGERKEQLRLSKTIKLLINRQLELWREAAAGLRLKGLERAHRHLHIQLHILAELHRIFTQFDSSSLASLLVKFKKFEAVYSGRLKKSNKCGNTSRRAQVSIGRRANSSTLFGFQRDRLFARVRIFFIRFFSEYVKQAKNSIQEIGGDSTGRRATALAGRKGSFGAGTNSGGPKPRSNRLERGRGCRDARSKGAEH